METKLNRIDLYLSQVEAFGFSGAILVGLGDNVIFQKAYGYANVEENIRSQINTVYDMGSITKPFTAVGIMKLAEEKRLGLHDRLVDYLEIFGQEWPEEKKNITIYHLLTHTSGIVDTLEDDYDEESTQKVLQRIMQNPLHSASGESYRYSNDGFTLLAMIIEKVTGEEYESFMKKNIFEPAHLHQTGYVLPKWDLANVSHGYVNFTNQGHSLQKSFPTWSLKGNGGMLSTVEDMFKWHLALEHNMILNQDTAKLMYTPYKNNYGCGWDIREENGETIISHDGASYYGTSACFYRNITSKLTIILFTNQSFNHFALIRFLMHHVKKIFSNNTSEEFLKTLSIPLDLEELPADLQNQRIKYTAGVEINWGKYFGLIDLGEAELLLTAEERKYAAKSKQLVQEFLAFNYETFSNAFVNKGILEQRIKTLGKVIQDYIQKHGEIDHVSIYGINPSVLVEDTTEVRIELKNDPAQESLYLYLFWKNPELLSMAGFAGIKDQGMLLVKASNNNRYLSLRLNDHKINHGFSERLGIYSI